MADLEITVDVDECIGCGACVTEAPETFDMNDEDKAFVKEPPHDEQDMILAGAEACPTDSIKVVDKATGEVLYPLD